MGDMMDTELVMRRATADDLVKVARLAASLVRQHHAFDPQRFFLQEPVEALTGGYEWWLGRELENDRAVIMVAEAKDELLGYAYATLEERDWNLLLDAAGALHDIYVDDRARRRGVGRALLRAIVAELERLGAPRVVLMSAVANTSAQALFKELGFRVTMLEMTRESRES